MNQARKIIILINIVLFFFTFNRARAVEQKRIPDDPSSSKRFGNSVDIAADYIVIGASDDADDRGSAYILKMDQGGSNNWGQIQKIIPSSPTGGDQFGSSVSINGSIVAVGSLLDNQSSGAVYIFYKNQGGADNWGEIIKITSSDIDLGDQFGCSVSLDNNILVVGSRFDDHDGLTDAGSAYIFYKDQGGADNWGQVAKITADDAQAGDNFGWSVVISGNNIAVGTPDDDDKGNHSGAVYVFEQDINGIWQQIVKNVPIKNGTAYLGQSVAMDGDYIVAGIPGYDITSGPTRAGMAYVYYRNQGGSDNWGIQDSLLAGDPGTEDHFGNSVDIFGNYIVVGAWYADLALSTDAGAAYSFLYSNNVWEQKRKLTASDYAQGDHYGIAVALANDFAVIGSKFDSYNIGGTNYTEGGSVYIYETVLDLSLPVTLSSFDANWQNQQVLLEWTTESEINNLGFNILRSEEEEGTYIEIASYQNNIELRGSMNSNYQKHYSYIDFKIQHGYTFWYKLMDVDINGIQNTHGPIKVSMNEVVSKFKLYPAYPNPFNISTNISFELPNSDSEIKNIDLSIFDLLGRRIKTLFNGIFEGQKNDYSWDGTDKDGNICGSGIYYVMLKNENYFQSEKIILMK